VIAELPEAAVEPERAGDDAADERRTGSVELLWDLVFAFAVTRVTTLLRGELSWAGLGRAMLALALVWWARSAFVWATDAHDPDSGSFRAVPLASTALIFVAGLARPDAYTSRAMLFVVAYALVRFLHLGRYADAARRGNASLAAIWGFALVAWETTREREGGGSSRNGAVAAA